jgi:hypothetical protein
VNVLVSSEPLRYTLAAALMYDIAKLFNVDDVYCIGNQGANNNNTAAGQQNVTRMTAAWRRVGSVYSQRRANDGFPVNSPPPAASFRVFGASAAARLSPAALKPFGCDGEKVTYTHIGSSKALEAVISRYI